MKKAFIKIGMAVLIVSSALLFNGCTGKDGAPGPQGAPGNANVLTTLGNAATSSWIYNSLYNEWDVTFNDPDITADVVATGTIQVFFGNGSGTSWSAIPSTYQGQEFNFTYSLGQVFITATLSSGAVPPNPGQIQFKFVVIPARTMMMHPHLNIKDYQQLKHELNLND